MAAVDCLDKFIYILSGSNVHFRTDTPVNSMADTDIFYTASAVYDQIQFLRCLFLSMTDFKFSGTCAVFIVDRIPGVEARITAISCTITCRLTPNCAASALAATGFSA